MSYEGDKLAFQKAISEFTSTTVDIGEALLQWVGVAGEPFAQRPHTVNGMAVFRYLCGDDPDEHPNPWGVSLYSPGEIERHWSEREIEGLGGDRSFLIGWLDGNGHDDAILMCNAPERCVAILNHEDVFAARDLDALVAETADREVLPIMRFVELLRPG